MSKLYILIGLPASGKTTWSLKKVKESDKTISWISSDSIRKELYGSEEDQQSPGKVFTLMFQRTLIALKDGHDCIYDATNLNRKRRINLINEIKKSVNDVEFIAVFFAIPYQICMARNLQRARVVPDAVILRMHKEITIPSIYEGFDRIELVENFNNCLNLYSIIEDAKKISHDNPHHSYTIGNHCVAAAEYIKEHSKEILSELDDFYYEYIYQATLYHDIGKVTCKVFIKKDGSFDGYAHYYGHENAGAYDYLCYSNSNVLSINERLLIALLINLHMSLYPYSGAAPKFLSIYPEKIKKCLKWINEADLSAH